MHPRCTDGKMNIMERKVRRIPFSYLRLTYKPKARTSKTLFHLKSPNSPVYVTLNFRMEGFQTVLENSKKILLNFLYYGALKATYIPSSRNQTSRT